MRETKLFEELLNLDSGLDIRLEGKFPITKITMVSKKGTITEEVLKKIMAVTKQNKAKIELKPFGILEVKF